jgi:glucokinase
MYNHTPAMVLALDIGGTKSFVGLCRPDGTVLAVRRIENRFDGAAAYWSALLDVVDELLTEKVGGKSLFHMAGIGFGGPIGRDGRLRSLHVGGWDGIDLSGDIGRRFGLRSTLGNDGNVAALGELTYGAGRGLDSIVYLTVSTGIGGGVIEQGEPLLGQRGLAAELGHIALYPDGPECSCGGRGCLEALASGTAIGRRLREALAAEGASQEALAAFPGAKEVFAAAAEGCPTARRVLDACLSDLARGLASIFNVFDPPVMVLGGGVPMAGDALFVPLRREMVPHVMRFRRGDVDLRPAQLGEYSVLLGAVALAMQA